MKQTKKNLGSVFLVLVIFLSVYLAQCGLKSDKIRAVADTSLEIWRVSDSTFAVISRDIRDGTELIVREDSLLALLANKLRGLLDRLEYKDTLRLGNYVSYIISGNDDSFADYVGGGTTITDSLKLSGPNPVVIFNVTSRDGRDFQIRSVPNGFELYDATAGLSRIHIDADGRIGFGAQAPIEAKMYLYGGASGANFDIRADDSNESSTVEVQSFDFETSFQSTYMQQLGPGVLGNAIDTIPNAGLGRLVFQGSANALIYTVFDDPLIFGTDFTERGRFTGSGEFVLKGPIEVIDSIVLNGLSIISGTAEPWDGLGSQGSLYMRNDNDSTLYTKTSVGWVLLN